MPPFDFHQGVAVGVLVVVLAGVGWFLRVATLHFFGKDGTLRRESNARILHMQQMAELQSTLASNSRVHNDRCDEMHAALDTKMNNMLRIGIEACHWLHKALVANELETPENSEALDRMEQQLERVKA
jgi:hypothetical protein